jgi:GNAT superfamily N-acetyltransferase
MDLIELDRLRPEQTAELVGDEVDPWSSAGVDLEWRPKDRYVALRDDEGRLAAAAGLVLAEVSFGGRPPTTVVGIGGVIVAAPYRGRGLGWRVISEVIARAEAQGPEIAVLFCWPDRAELYRRHGFAEVPGPVWVGQAERIVAVPHVTMWRPLKPGAALPDGDVRVEGLPF